METHQYSNFALISQHLIISICALLLPLAASAQTQQGHVRTLGRPDAKGVALSGVAVRVKGEHNAVLSGADGSFAIALPGKKNGEAYVLQQVRKAGYELNENGVIGRQFAFSDKVPLTLVMVSTSQLQADKQRIENTAYQVAERNYKTKMEALERQREAGSLAAEQYRAEIQDLQDKFEKYQSLIDDLAEHYAHTDYDLLNEHDREINLCIERGDLDRADSLIHALFDPVDVLRRNKEALAHIDQSEAQARQLLAQANEDMAAVLKQQAKDAEYLYQLYTIALARYDNEKAAQYIQTRAELDTTNVEWQMNAGGHMRYVASYALAITYYQRALHILAAGADNQERLVCGCHSNLGVIYARLGLYDEALVETNEAIRLYSQLNGEKSFDVVTSYSNLAAVYRLKGDKQLALDNYVKAVKLMSAMLSEPGFDASTLLVPHNLENILTLYMNWADFERGFGHYDEALRVLREVMTQFNVSAWGDNRLHALLLNNIGMIYYDRKDFDNAMSYYEKSLDIFKRIFGEQHPNVALLYNNIGELCRSKGDFSLATEHHKKALDIRRLILGNSHPLVIQSLNNLGNTHNEAKQYSEALSILQEALDLTKEQNESVATIENIMGLAYFHLGNYEEADRHCSRAFEIERDVNPTNYFLMATIAGNLFVANDSLHREVKAAEYRNVKLRNYGKLIENNDFYRTDHFRLDYALEFQELGHQYYFLGREDEADSCYQEAKRVFTLLPQKSYSEIAYAFMIEAAASFSISNFKKTYCFCRQALDLLSVMYNGVHADIASCYNTLATFFSATGKDEMALEYTEKSIAILEQLYPNGDESLFPPYALQATIRFKHFTAEFQKAKALKDSGIAVSGLDDFGSEEAFTKALAIYEKYFPNDKDKIEQVIPALVTVYLLRGAFCDEAAKVQYQEKLKDLAEKYPQLVVATLKRFRGEQ